MADRYITMIDPASGRRVEVHADDAPLAMQRGALPIGAMPAGGSKPAALQGGSPGVMDSLLSMAPVPEQMLPQGARDARDIISTRLANKAVNLAPSLINPFISSATELPGRIRDAMGVLQGKNVPTPSAGDAITSAFGIDRRAVAEDAAAHNVPGLMTETAVPIFQTLAGGRVMGKVMPKAPVAQGEAAVNKLSYAAGASGGEFNFPAALRNVMPDLLETTRSAIGSVGKMGLSDFPNIIRQTGQRLELQFRRALEPIAQQPAQDFGKRAGAAIRSQITETMRKDAPDTAAALEADAAAMESKPWTLNDLNELRQQRMAENQAFHNQSLTGQITETHKAIARKTANRVVEQIARQDLYDALERSGGINQVRALKDKQGNLLKLGDFMEDQSVRLENASAFSKGQPRTERLTGGSLYADPSIPPDAGIHIGGIMNLITPKAARHLSNRSSALRSALQYRTERPGVGLLTNAILSDQEKAKQRR